MAVEAGRQTTRPISVRPFEGSAAAWDDFVMRHEHGSPFHLTAWKNVIERTYGYRSHYLCAWRGDEITAVLPMFLIRNPGGRALISTPFAVYGGILAADEQSRKAISEGLAELAASLKVQYVDLRNAHESQCGDFARVRRYVTFTQDIGPDQNILENIPRKTRYMVRKSLKGDLRTVVCSHPSADFLDLYTRNLRRMGTPSFPKRHFENLFRFFEGSIDVREVRHGDEAIAAVLTLYFRDRVLPYYGASNPACSALAPNNFMYYDLMTWGQQNGYRVFDFGRSRSQGSTSYDFKAHWGMMERELPYEMLLVRRKNLPNFSPANSAFDLPRRVWSGLPLGLTRAIGPMFVRLFP